MSELADPTRARVLAQLRRHGWNASSFQVLEREFSYWFDADESCVAYVDTGGAWVAAGAPVAAEARLAEVAARFDGAAEAAGRRACFFGVEQRFLDRTAYRGIAIGEQPVWDPARWQAVLDQSRSLREQLRRARAKEVTVRRLTADELANADAPARRALDQLIRKWLGSRPMEPMGFLVQLDPYAFARERRSFVAERDGAVVAFLGAVPIYARRGWLIEDLLRAPDAPNGTLELLVDAAMRAAHAEDVAEVTLGLAPLSGPVPSPLRWARASTAWLYDFEGLRGFKAKLRPERWDMLQLALPARAATIRSIFDVLAAFARGDLFRFGVRTVLRGPRFVLQALAALLVPWTAGLALASPRWFPAPWVQAAWVAFDVALAVMLWRLARHWTQALGTLLPVLVTLDAIVTATEALLFNVPQLRGAPELLVLGVATLAPSTAAVVLWRARALRLS